MTVLLLNGELLILGQTVRISSTLAKATRVLTHRAVHRLSKSVSRGSPEEEPQRREVRPQRHSVHRRSLKFSKFNLANSNPKDSVHQVSNNFGHCSSLVHLAFNLMALSIKVDQTLIKVLKITR